MTHDADIIVIVDDQNGFEGTDLPVPGGAEVGPGFARLVHHAHGKIIILTQDFHPQNHISFYDNHPGIPAPFTDIYLRRGTDGVYRPVAAHVDGAPRAVSLNREGYITAIHDAPAVIEAGDIRQTLWTRHCQQGTASALFSPELMAELPEALVTQLENDITSPVLRAGPDDRGNLFFVIRKGMRRDLDSYGMATENDGISLTQAPRVFEEIAAILRQRQKTQVKIATGGLATNFCVEFSHEDQYRHFVPCLARQGIQAGVMLLTDLCRAIPVSIPGGAWPDSDAAESRMAARGTALAMADDLIRAWQKGRGPQDAAARLTL